MIGGNITAEMLIFADGNYNEIGERVNVWAHYRTLHGFIDLMSGDSKYTYDSKLQESTHVFICDYVDIDRHPEDKRLSCNGLIYDVLLIDDPMELHQHIEIYLKKVT